LLEPFPASFGSMSDDGSTLVNSYSGFPRSLAIERGAGWETIAESGHYSDFFSAGGISDDGSVISYTGNGPVNFIWRSGDTEEVPAVEVDGIAADWVAVDGVSGDGTTVGVRQIGEWGSRLYLYRGGAYLDIGVRADGAVYSQRVSGLDRTGSVATINDREYVELASGEDRRRLRAWVWEAGELERIPDLSLGGEFVHTEAEGVSSDGTAAFGYSVANDGVYNDRHGWIYQHGVLHAVDEGLHVYSEVLDISDDGSVALVTAGDLSNTTEASYLWSAEGGLVLIDEVLLDQGIVIEGDVVHYFAISGDGNTLTASVYHDQGDYFQQVVVTIPSPGALLMLGGGLLILSSRRR